MAEGAGIEDVLGGESEDREGGTAAPGADAVALSLAMRGVAQDPELARNAGEYLVEQKRFVQLQIRHFEEERLLAIGAAKRKRYADRIRNCVATGVALVLLGLIVAIGKITLEAMNDHARVVEAFTVPPDLAARGASGEALAEELAGRLAAIGAVAYANSVTGPDEIRADRTDALKVEIPETGVSLAELERFFHRWLGHQTVISGEVRNEADGEILIGLHIAGAPPIEVRGRSADLERLMQQTAETAFATFDPQNYMIYLFHTEREPEAMKAAEKDAQAAMSTSDRAVAYALLADLDPNKRRALPRALLATDIDPQDMLGWREAAVATAKLGHDQAAADYYHAVLRLRIDEQAPRQRKPYLFLVKEARAAVALYTGDFTTFEVESRSYGVDLNDDYAISAEAAADLHDESRARERLALASVAGPVDLYTLEASWVLSCESGNWSKALGDVNATVEIVETKSAAASGRRWNGVGDLDLQTVYRPRIAYAEAMNGDTAAASALIAESPTDCYLCVRIRGQIAAAANDPAEADRWFAEAIRQAPKLPLAYAEWGQVLLARDDLERAAQQFALAHERGPHFADPLKGWGDVLVKQGHAKEALAKYGEALKYAPHWEALQAARAAAAHTT